jgi:hypothetical protein
MLYTSLLHDKLFDWEVDAIFWLENLKGRDHSEDLGVDGRIMLELILGK